MAWIQCNYHSDILGKTMGMEVIIPEPDIFYKREELLKAGTFPVVYLLHGRNGTSIDWIRNTSVERYAMENQTAVVMPSVDNGCYENMGGSAYWTYLTEEVKAKAEAYFPVSKRREESFVAGAGEGAYGALKWGAEFPGRFHTAGCISPVWEDEQKLRECQRKYREHEGQDRKLPELLEYAEAPQEDGEYCDRSLGELFRALPLPRNLYKNW